HSTESEHTSPEKEAACALAPEMVFVVSRGRFLWCVCRRLVLLQSVVHCFAQEEGPHSSRPHGHFAPRGCFLNADVMNAVPPPAQTCASHRVRHPCCLLQVRQST